MRDDKYAVMCVKHLHQPDINVSKMDARLQYRYHRKNWSSFVLWNCGHKANEALTAEKVNCMKGSDLHAFSWLGDTQIGSLPFSYNYISGVSPKNQLAAHHRPDVIHYTEGGPWFEQCQKVPFASHWLEEHDDWISNGNGLKISGVPSIAAGNRITKDD